MNRRNFMRGTLAGAAAAGLAGGAAGGRLIAAAEDSPKPKNGQMIRRPLGKTGIELPAVNMGVMNATLPELIKRSYALGARYFDTAAYYQRGQNEIMVGRALEEMGVRGRTVIGTKVYIPHERRPSLNRAELKEIFLKTAEESLSRLRTGYLDILYIHNVLDSGYLNNPGIREAMLTLKDQGKVKHIGFSVHMNMAELILDSVRSGLFEVIQTAFNYSMADDDKLIDALRAAHAAGIGLVAMKTQCTQYWYKDYVPPEKQGYYSGEVLHTAVLKWVLNHPFIACAIPGYTTFDQMETDLAVARDLTYSEEERRFLGDRDVKMALRRYCIQCGRCAATCSGGADIPSLMRIHMYATCYGNLDETSHALRNTVATGGLAACANCETCGARCVRRVPVGKRVEELKSFFG